MAFYNTYFTDFAGLQNAIAQHPENEFIGKPTGQRGADPLPLLFPDSAASYGLRVRDDGVIVASVTLSQSYHSPAASVVGQLSVREGEKRQGHGQAMLHALFSKAAQDSRTLIMTPFEREGVAASPAVPSIHGQYPTVEILYNGQPKAINGYRRYILQPTAFGVAPITF